MRRLPKANSFQLSIKMQRGAKITVGLIAGVLTVYLVLDQRTTPQRSHEVESARVVVLPKLRANSQLSQQELEEFVRRRAKASRQFATREEVDRFLKTHGENPINYALAALLTDASSYWTEALARWPDDPSLLLAWLLNDSSFLKAQENTQKLRELNPKSAWPDVLLAYSQLKEGNYDQIEPLLRAALDNELDDISRQFEEPLAEFQSSIRGIDARTATAPHAALNQVRMDYHLKKFIRDLNLTKQGEDSKKPLSDSAIAAGLALSEVWSRGARLDAASEWEAISAQKQLVERLGKERAQQFLSAPYEDFLKDLASSSAGAVQLMDAITEYRATLDTQQLLDFNRRAREVGDRAAFEAAKAGVQTPAHPTSP